MSCEHTNTQHGECVHCGAILEHLITSCPKPPKRVEDPVYRSFVRGLVCCAILLDGPGIAMASTLPTTRARVPWVERPTTTRAFVYAPGTIGCGMT